MQIEFLTKANGEKVAQVKELSQGSNWHGYPKSQMSQPSSHSNNTHAGSSKKERYQVRYQPKAQQPVMGSDPNDYTHDQE